jgi:5,10-methylenetetrahydrofolate reductase
MSIADALTLSSPVIAAELRPPRAELALREGMDAWIDTYHAVRSLTRSGIYVFLTDSAVGLQEEDNLRHLVANLGGDVPREKVVPFLTSKHRLEYCLSYAGRAWQHEFRSLVVLGGDKSVGPPRSVEHAWQLRQAIRKHEPRLSLGGWANPNRDAERQVGFLQDADFTGEFYLTQIVSHHDVAPVAQFMNAADRKNLALHGLFGVFFYRSANAATLGTLSRFLPVPVEALTKEFSSGATPVDVAARTIRAMMDVGVRHFYVSNLPLGRAESTLTAILNAVRG